METIEDGGRVMPCNQRIAVDGMVMSPVDEWGQIARNYNRLIVTLEILADAIGHGSLPEVKEACAAIKEAREI